MTEYKDAVFPAIFQEEKEKMREHDRLLLQSLEEWSHTVKSILEKGISFDDNVDLKRVTVTSHATPGTEFSVAHTLGKVPIGYIVYKRGGAGTVYDGTTANDATTLYLRSDASSTSFSLMVF